MTQSEDDHRFMRAAIRLSTQHLGLTFTNPSVGALVVQKIKNSSVIVGRGVTAPGGRPHAEKIALSEAGSAARGATAYVTLEPCSHYGQTPPCALALIEAKIARVVIALQDPDQRVSGQGIKLLRDAGIEVIIGVEEFYARTTLNGYLTFKTMMRPEITVKMALSQDNGIGKFCRGAVKITNQTSHNQVHILRAQTDAIMVGINTVLADDPLLTCRLPGLEHRSPIRIVIDPALRLPVGSRLVSSATKAPLWVFTHVQFDSDKKQLLEQKHVLVLPLPMLNEKVDLLSLAKQLRTRNITTLLVEGGAKTVEYLIAQNLVDRLQIFSSGHAIGEFKVNAPQFESLKQCYVHLRHENLDGDMYDEWMRTD